MSELLRANPDDKIWVLLEDQRELDRYRRNLTDASVRYVVYDPIFSRPMQEKDIVFGSDMRQEIESFILNYNRQSRNILPPSHLENSRNILILFYAKLELDRQELACWKQRLYNSRVEIGLFSIGNRMFVAISKYPKHSVFVVLPQSLDAEFGPALASYPHVKRLVLLEPPYQRPTYYEHPSVTYLARSVDEVNSFLKTLRYSLRHPPKSIAQNFSRSTINVMIPRNQYDMEYLQFIALLNPGVRMFPYSAFNELVGLLKADPYCDALVIGDAELKNKSLKSYHPSVKLLINNEFNHGSSNFIVMSTDDEREVLLYIKNLPNNRYIRAKSISTPVDIFFDSTAAATKPLLSKA